MIRSKRSFIIVLAILFAVIFATPAFCALTTPVARVNLTKTVVITQQEIDEKIALYEQQGQTIDSATVLEALIASTLFDQATARDGYVLGDDAKNQLLESQRVSLASNFGLSTLTDEELEYVCATYIGLSVDEYKEYLAQQYILQAYVMQMKADMFTEENILPTDAEIEAVYKANKTIFVASENVKLSHIFFDFGDGQKEKAQDVLSQIKSGKVTFEKAVSQYSEDTESASKAGEVGWLAIDDSDTLSYMGQNFYDKVFSLDAGEISDVVESLQGYHIVKVTVHNDAKLLGIDDKINPADETTVRDYIASAIYEQKVNDTFNAAYLAIIEDLKAQASIKYL